MWVVGIRKWELGWLVQSAYLDVDARNHARPFPVDGFRSSCEGFYSGGWVNVMELFAMLLEERDINWSRSC